MTNATQDILRGDMVSGVAHCARAIMIAAMVAGGAIIGTHLASAIGLMAQSSMPVSGLPFVLQAVIAFVSSYLAGSGFGFLMSAPKKSDPLGRFSGRCGLFHLLAVHANRHGGNGRHVPWRIGRGHWYADRGAPL